MKGLNLEEAYLEHLANLRNDFYQKKLWDKADLVQEQINEIFRRRVLK